MATPVVAAAAALVYQYLNSSYYPTVMDVRASLVKAMIVHSGVPTKGFCDKSYSCYEYSGDHQYYEGHGRMQLDTVLRFDESPFELFLYYGQINDKKESFSIEVPLNISFMDCLMIS